MKTFQIIQMQLERLSQVIQRVSLNLKDIIPEPSGRPKHSISSENRLQTVMGVALLHREDENQNHKSLYSV